MEMLLSLLQAWLGSVARPCIPPTAPALGMVASVQAGRRSGDWIGAAHRQVSGTLWGNRGLGSGLTLSTRRFRVPLSWESSSMRAAILASESRCSIASVFSRATSNSKSALLDSACEA